MVDDILIQQPTHKMVLQTLAVAVAVRTELQGQTLEKVDLELLFLDISLGL
jgi:hypothetical protein